MAVLNAAYMGSFILTPLLLQNVMAFSETKTGLLSIARPLAFAIAGPLAARVVHRLGARTTASSGAVAVVVALVLMAMLGADSTELAVMGALALAGVGMGLASPPLSASVTVSVDESDYGIAGAAQQMMIQVGVVFGITVMQSVQQTRLPAVGLEGSYHWGYAAGVVLAAFAVFTASRIASTHRVEPALHPESEPLPAL
jgi:MFS family permease